MILERRGVTKSDTTVDSTDYSLTVRKNYESYAQKLKDKVKENPISEERGKKASKITGRGSLLIHSQ